MRTTLTKLAAAVAAATLIGCSEPATTTSAADTSASQETVAAVQSESEKANALFEKMFMDAVMRSPMYQSYMGIKTDNDKWDDLSDENAKKELEISKQNLKLIQALNYDALDEQTKLSYELAVENINQEILDFKWRFHNYPVNQMFGIHSQVPALLINTHRIDNVDDAKAYISRLNGTVTLMNQVIEQLKSRESLGIMPPKFVYPLVIESSKNIISGAPFDEGEDNTLLADFKKKVETLEITPQERQNLINEANTALTSSVKPAYEALIATLTDQQSRATNDDGAWKFPDGETFYNNALERTTTTKLTADEIHQIGLDEVARIHDEMRAIMTQVGFEGDLQAFFEFMRTDEQFYYPETEEGKQQYLDEATALINTMKGRLDELFIIKPKADLEVKRVEAFRERAAGKAFYQQPAPDGSRPGMYYANLYRMSDMPTYQMEALAYHEGVPGHHMQIAIAQELEGIPKFRKYGRYTAYTEGWGLYSELVPKEIGFYSDPYSDFGRLAMEIWRACRLVVDTGIHSKKWTREQAISYLAMNTPNPQGDIVKAIERYIVMPSQATAYKIGMIKILELREKARDSLGDKFDIRKFHNTVLKNGPLPLNVLERKVDEYIADSI